MFGDIKDEKGNKIVSKRVKNGYKFYIYLVGYQYPKMISQFVNGQLHFVRTPEHIFVKTNSYGFNDNFIRKFPAETVVIVREKGSKIKLKTSVGDIIDNGKYMYFLSQGFEKQIFLNRSLFSTTL